ncbi:MULTISPECIES: ABC transporter substrate-binding protein [Roseobacteraceae]|uniref:Heme-binding protein A n=1 Tax=Pseudosulfitobacter pseudonitzschiae TaxID=1402135 RepID=A0A221K5S4_9RHOB|nr:MULTISPECIES: ABC transporter substrate-binding protein [Roseobacteraceae]ASM74354.1 heme-binding protein A [Pseudosulfitobacter pseudonitzschiae]
MNMNRRQALIMSASAMLMAATGRSAYAQTETGDAVIRFAPHAALRVLDPVATPAYITRNHSYLVYDTLYSLDSSFTPQPQMIGSHEVTDDGLEWTFILRDGLAFHDGAPVTAADVVPSITRWWQKDVVGLRLKEVTETLEAVDDKTFMFRLKEPFGAMIEAMARPSSRPLFVMPKRIADLDPSTMLEEVVGSGPYKFLADEFRPGASWAYARNEDYIPRDEPADGLAGGKVPRAARIEVIWFPSPDTAISALINNELDIIESVSPDGRSRFEGTDVKLVARASPTASTVRFNWSQAPFDDVRMRRAVQLVVSQIDYMDIVVGDPSAYETCPAYFGCGTPLETDAGYVEGSLDNVEEARALVAEAGYDGTPITIITPGDIASFSALAPMTQQVLEAIGIPSKIETMEWSAFLERRTRTTLPSEGGWNLAHAVFDLIDLISPLGNPNFDARGLDGYTGFVDDPETEALKSRYQAASTDDERFAIVEEMQERAYDQVFYIPLGTYAQYTALRPELSDFENAPIHVVYGLDKA